MSYIIDNSMTPSIRPKSITLTTVFPRLSSAKWCTLLTHWGRVTHICVSKLTTIGTDNGLSPGRRQAIIWTNAGKLLFGPPGTNFSEISIEIHTFSFKKMYLKASSGKRRPSCLGLNVLKVHPVSPLCRPGTNYRWCAEYIWQNRERVFIFNGYPHLRW